KSAPQQQLIPAHISAFAALYRPDGRSADSIGNSRRHMDLLPTSTAQAIEIAGKPKTARVGFRTLKEPGWLCSALPWRRNPGRGERSMNEDGMMKKHQFPIGKSFQDGMATTSTLW